MLHVIVQSVVRITACFHRSNEHIILTWPSADQVSSFFDPIQILRLYAPIVFTLCPLFDTIW
jgi:hypothetical protein